jgi:hypothetical protein
MRTHTINHHTYPLPKQQGGKDNKATHRGLQSKEQGQHHDYNQEKQTTVSGIDNK